MTGDAEFFSIDLTDGTHLKFKSFDEIQVWLDKQTGDLQWFFEGANRAGGSISNIASNYWGALHNLRNALGNWRSNPDQAGYKQQLYEGFANVYNNQKFLRPDHKFARIGAEIARTDGNTAGAAAVGFLLGAGIGVSAETVVGLTKAILIRDGVHPKSAGIVEKQIGELTSQYRDVQRKQDEEWSAKTSSAQTLIDDSRDKFAQIEQLTKTNSAEALAEIDAKVLEAINSIKATERSYHEQMKLQAPVSYWNTKAVSHGKSLWWSRWRLILFVIVGSGGLLYGLLELANRASILAASSPHDAIIYLKFSAIGIVATTIVLMVGRMLLRIYLSDRHLLTDAEERIAMIQTYLALSNEGKVTETERALVLAPLFRSASDGIVKDEGMDASIVGLLAKGIEKIK